MRFLILLSLGLIHYSDCSRSRDFYQGFRVVLDQSKILENHKNGEILCGIRNMYHNNQTSSWTRTNLYAPECDTGLRFGTDCQKIGGAGNYSKTYQGTQSKKGEFPWQVSLRDPITRRTFCGGVVITDQHVLTAAHSELGLLVRWERRSHFPLRNRNTPTHFDPTPLFSHLNYHFSLKITYFPTWKMVFVSSFFSLFASFEVVLARFMTDYVWTSVRLVKFDSFRQLITIWYFSFPLFSNTF